MHRTWGRNSAPSNINFASFLPQKGVLIFGATIPAVGKQVYASIGIPEYLFAMGESVPSAGTFVVGGSAIDISSIALNYVVPAPVITVTQVAGGIRPTLTATFTRAGVTVSTGLLVVITTTKDGSNPTIPPTVTYGGTPLVQQSTLFSGGYAARSTIFSLPVSTGSASLVFTGPLGTSCRWTYASYNVQGLASNTFVSAATSFDTSGTTNPTGVNSTPVTNVFSIAFAAMFPEPTVGTWSAGWTALDATANSSGTESDLLQTAWQLIPTPPGPFPFSLSGAIPTDSWDLTAANFV